MCSRVIRVRDIGVTLNRRIVKQVHKTRAVYWFQIRALFYLSVRVSEHVCSLVYISLSRLIGPLFLQSSFNSF